MNVFAATDVGKVRTINEDSFYAPGAGEEYVMVADGMGGHQAGEVASRIAVEEVSRWLKIAPRPSEDALRHALTEANLRIFRESRGDVHKAGMGTTLTVLWFGEGSVFLLHVGDSRAYLIRNGVAIQITRDHSVVGEMVERGELTPEQARVHPQRNFITRCLGAAGDVEPDIARLVSRPDDIWLLCSDGLSNYVKSQEIAQVMCSEGSHDDHVHTLVQMALDRGGADNVTVVAAVQGGLV